MRWAFAPVPLLVASALTPVPPGVVSVLGRGVRQYRVLIALVRSRVVAAGRAGLVAHRSSVPRFGKVLGWQMQAPVQRMERSST